jgi:hypothetical protein
MGNLSHFPENSGQYISDPSHAKPGIHPFPDKLYVVTMVENHLRWRSRIANYFSFAHHVETGGAILFTAEIALGNRPFEVTEATNPSHLQLRVQDEMWRKENAWMVMVSRLPESAKYVLFCDADMEFVRPDWAQEILHQLQHYPVIQPYSHLQDLGPDSQPVGAPQPSLVYYQSTSKPDTFTGASSPFYGKVGGDGLMLGAPGGAWAYRMEALSALGGLIEWSIIGSADTLMAQALYGSVDSVLPRQYSANYKMLARNWQANALKTLQRNIGYMPGLMYHRWHGKRSLRGYGFRRSFTIRVHFDPLADIRKDRQGLYQLTGRNIDLRDGLRQYARYRNEDSTEL